MADVPILSPDGRERDVDGLYVPLWLPGDDQFAERLQVDVVWSPHIYVNGHEVHPFALPVIEPPLYSASGRLFRRAVEKGPGLGRVLTDELEAVAAALGQSVDEFQRLTFGTVESALRVALGRRGYPT